MLRLYLGLGLTIIAGGLCGCGEPPAASNAALGPALELPTGVLSGSTDINLPSALGEPLPSGVEAAFIHRNEVDLLILQLDPDRLEAIIVGAPEAGISAADTLQTYDLEVVIGSGFVAELHSLQPVGLLQVDGATLNPLQSHGYTRILGINDNGMGVVHKEAYQRDLFHSAIQAGPGIIEQGELDISERDLQRPKYFRSFIAVCKNRWLAGISLTPTHLRTLGQVVLDFVAEQNWQCPEVVNLAGDRQAVTLLRTGNGEVVYHGDPNTYKASLIGFKRKSD